MSSQADLQEVQSKYDKVRSLYESLTSELENIAKEAKELGSQIDSAVDKQKMHDILVHIKDLPE